MSLDRLVLVSRWAVSELWWTARGSWLRTHDRPIGELTDAEVLRWFGDEAFRRRDLLLASEESAFEPEVSELIGRRVRDVVFAAGWDIIVDDSLGFRACRADKVIAVVPSGGRHPELEVFTPSGHAVVSDLSIAERDILASAIDGRTV